MVNFKGIDAKFKILSGVNINLTFIKQKLTIEQNSTADASFLFFIIKDQRPYAGRWMFRVAFFAIFGSRYLQHNAFR